MRDRLKTMSFYGSRQFSGTPPTSVPSGRRSYYSSNVSTIPPINNRPLVHSPSYQKSPFYTEKSPSLYNYSPSKYSNSTSYSFQNGNLVKTNDASIKLKLREMQKKDETPPKLNRPIKSTFNVVYEPKSISTRLKRTTDQLSNLSVTSSIKKSTSHQNMSQDDLTNDKSPFRSKTRPETSVHYRSNLLKSTSRQRTSNSFSINKNEGGDDEDDDGRLFCPGSSSYKSSPKQKLDSDGKSSESSASNYSINNNFAKMYSNKGLTGLQNIGNTCFMNCVLQCLSNTRPLLELTLDPPHDLTLRDNKSRMRGSLISAYKDLMQTMWSGASVYSPSSFKYEVSKFAKLFAGYNQQDAQEFLMYLLQGLHEELNRSRGSKKNRTTDLQRVLDDNHLSASEKAERCWSYHLEFENSYIVDIFEGQLKSSLTCGICGYVSDTFDPFLGLSLPIPKTSRGSEATLIDCLDLFTQEEVLGENEKTTCDKCRRKQNSTKRLSIQKFPPILIINLKRFSDGGFFRSKLTTHISFPIKKLDLSGYSDEPDTRAEYRLYGVCNHSGSLSGGHYTSHSRHPYTSQWHHFNDSRVSNVSDHNIVSSEAYILFYESINN